MTMVLKESNREGRTMSKEGEGLYILDAITNECTYYELFSHYPIKHKVQVNPRIFKTHNELLIRNDLIDCQIDICSLEVPALFTENFDYQDMRGDFLVGILESEILGKRIFCHIIKSEYAATASTQQVYDSISKDVIQRWTYPIVPDNMRNQHYVHSRFNIYKEKGLSISRFFIFFIVVQRF
jgi:translation initiation factor eIF-2B subunit epsilon